MISGWIINKSYYLYANWIFSGVQLHHRVIAISQQTEKTINRYVTTNFSAHVVVTFSVISIFQLRIANWPHHPRFGLAECARRVSIRRPRPRRGAVRAKLSNAQFQIPRTFCPIPSFTSFTSSSNPPKVPPAAPRIPPGLPKWVRLFHFGRPSVAIFRFLAHFLPSPKLIKIWHRPKASQNLKNGGPRPSKLDFGPFWEPFWHTFPEMFWYFYEKGEKRADTAILQYN